MRLEDGEFDDGQGGRWPSVRDAFWCGHLKMPDVHFADEQQELLLRVLASIDERGTISSSSRIDLFGGDAMIWRFYMCWLASIGMLDMRYDHSLTWASPLDSGLSEEGRSVLLMLQLTRKIEWERLPLKEIVEAISRSGRETEDRLREEALQAFERSVGRRRWTFARERLNDGFLIKLIGIAAHGRMPTMGVMWSIRFADARHRDDLFAWFAARVDRWEDWGELAYGRGADEFTRHVLSMLVADTGALA